MSRTLDAAAKNQPMRSFEEVDHLAFSLSGVDGKIWAAMDEQERVHYRLMATDSMRKRFVQIVITKLDDGRYHITWQDEHTVVRSMDTDPIEASIEVLETIGALEVPDPKRANDCP